MTTIGPRCQEILLVLTIIMILIIPAIYVIAGIFILIDDYEIYKECNKTSDLHVYVILSIFAFFLNSCCYNSFEKENIMFFPVNLLLLIEISLIVWGIVEIFYRVNDCPGLKYSNLYIFAIITLFIQILFFIAVLVKIYFIECKKSEVRPIDLWLNTKIKIDISKLQLLGKHNKNQNDFS